MNIPSKSSSEANPTLREAKRAKREPDWWEHSWSWLIPLAFTIAIWFLLGFFPWYEYVPGFHAETLSTSAPFGDSFGAVNALMSAAALAFLILALYRQQTELRHMREEYRLTTKEHRLTRKEHKSMVAQQKEMVVVQRKGMLVELIRIYADAAQALIEHHRLRQTEVDEDPGFYGSAVRSREAEALSVTLSRLASIATLAQEDIELAEEEFRALQRSSTIDAMIRLQDVLAALRSRVEKKSLDLNNHENQVAALTYRFENLAGSLVDLGIDAGDLHVDVLEARSYSPEDNFSSLLESVDRWLDVAMGSRDATD